MNDPDEFEPTLDVPPLWIRELTGTAQLEDTPLPLSYFPWFQQRLTEIGCTISDIEADFAGGYFLQRKTGDRGVYYVLESAAFKIWANPRAGQTRGSPLVVLSRIEVASQPLRVDKARLRGVTLQPIQYELEASADVLVERQAAYQQAYRTLNSPPPREPRVTTNKTEATDGLWRYQALVHLLDALWSHSKHIPPVFVTGKVLDAEDGALIETEMDRVLRFEIKESLSGWKADSRVQVDGFSSKIRDIEGQVITLEAPEGFTPKPGEMVHVTQEPRFAMAAHQRALRKFLNKEIAGVWENLRSLLAAPAELDSSLVSTKFASPSSSSSHLTGEQRSAVEGAVSTPHAFFIQGPPGTGKTTVITEIVERLAARGERVFLLSSTHVAVDEVLRRVRKKPGVWPVRLSWDADRVDSSVRPFVYETARDALVKKVLSPRENAEAFWSDRKSAAGVHADHQATLERMADRWIAAGHEPGAEEELKNEIGDALLQAANLICATTVGVAKQKFAHIGNVDTLIVDEASRVTDAEFLIGAVRAKRWILVGDEHQLPPHVEPDMEYLLLAMVACCMVGRNKETDLPSAVKRIAKEWEEDEEQRPFREQSVLDVATPLFEGTDWEEHYRSPFEQALLLHQKEGEDGFRELVRTIRYFFIQSSFERGVEACPPALRARLSEQRRMIEPITRFVRDPVYRGAYRSPSPATLLRLGLTPLICDGFPTPVTFLNTQFQRREAAEEMVGTGFVNALEARWIVEACEYFEDGFSRDRNSPPISVSILCFYSEQARRIRNSLQGRQRGFQKLQFRVIDAIDRIQGQESDIVFISFCRARPPRQSLSEKFGLWLRDIRRLNVAFTRARRALVLVGHRPTLEKLGDYQPFYLHLFKQFDLHGSELRMVQDFGDRRRR